MNFRRSSLTTHFVMTTRRERCFVPGFVLYSVNPNYDDVIKALEAVGERNVAQQLRDKFTSSS